MAQQSRQRSRTRNTPQRDNRDMVIPPGTIRMDVPREIRFPLVWLRQVIFGLLALIALPVGFLFFLSGGGIEANPVDSVAATATIVRETDSMFQISYDADPRGIYQLQVRQWNNFEGFFRQQADGAVWFLIHPCDVIAPLRLLPLNEGDTFTVWYNSENVANSASCIPQTADAGSILRLIGAGMMIVSGWILFTAIMRAAGYRGLKRRMNDIKRAAIARHNGEV